MKRCIAQGPAAGSLVPTERGFADEDSLSALATCLRSGAASFDRLVLLAGDDRSFSGNLR
jgi:hypothetical protein